MTAGDVEVVKGSLNSRQALIILQEISVFYPLEMIR